MTYATIEDARAAGRRYWARRSAEKVRGLESRIANRPRYSERELAWAAGIFEGEGTIAIVTTRDTYTRSVVCLSNTDEEIIQFLQARWPGIITQRPPTVRHKRAWTWRLQGNHTLGFLQDVLPYFVTSAERRKAELLIVSQRARWAGYKLAGHNERMAAYASAMRALNRKGPGGSDA